MKSFGNFKFLVGKMVHIPKWEFRDVTPLLHTMMGACKDIILHALPCLGNGFISELLKVRDLVPKGIGLAQRKKTWREMHWSFSPRLTLPPCWNRTTILPFLIMKMERGEGVPHPELLLRWWMCFKFPRNVGDEHWHPPRPCHRMGFVAPYWWELV
jgi:hypothetical protein